MRKDDAQARMPREDGQYLRVLRLVVDIAVVVQPALRHGEGRGVRGVPEVLRVVDVPHEGHARLLRPCPERLPAGGVKVRHGVEPAHLRLALQQLYPVTPGGKHPLRKGGHVRAQRVRVEVIFAHIKPGENVEAAGVKLFQRERLRRRRYAPAVRHGVDAGHVRARAREKLREAPRVELRGIVHMRVDDLHAVIHCKSSFYEKLRRRASARRREIC